MIAGRFCDTIESPRSFWDPQPRRIRLAESTRELCTRIASGDPEALSRFYAQHFDFMYGCARRSAGRDESTCLDIVHNAMLRVIKAIPKTFEQEVELRAWVARVVRSCALDMLRGEQRRQRRNEIAATRDTERSTTPPPDSLSERIAWLRAEMDLQGEETATLIRLRHALGWTLSRIGRTFNLSPGAVDGRINRALSSMRDSAKETFDEP